MARAWAWLRVIFGRHELHPQTVTHPPRVNNLYRMEQTAWSPERKIVGAAIAGLVTGVVQHVFGFDLWPGAEAAATIVVAYLLPNRSS